MKKLILFSLLSLLSTYCFSQQKEKLEQELLERNEEIGELKTDNALTFWNRYFILRYYKNEPKFGKRIKSKKKPSFRNPNTNKNNTDKSESSFAFIKSTLIINDTINPHYKYYTLTTDNIKYNITEIGSRSVQQIKDKEGNIISTINGKYTLYRIDSSKYGNSIKEIPLLKKINSI